MLRQSSSRNQRSKGLKLKKALQISLLVMVSVWLLYQVKHSYEKKYSEGDTNDLHKDDKNQEEIIRLGRKDLPTTMDADSSTLDERTEDEENDEMEQEMKHDENDEDPIDEQDLDKDDDLPEPGEHSSDKDGDDNGVFEDEERKERSQEDQEKNFHGDNVSSAVSHDPPSSERDLSHHAQEKILFVDDASSAVPHEKQETRHEEEVRKAREMTFRGDDVSSSVDHDAKVTKPLPDEQLNNMDRIFEGTTNLSNGISFRGPELIGLNATEEQHESAPTNTSSHLNAGIPKIDSESHAHPTPLNLTSNSDPTNSTLKGEQQTNSTLMLNNPEQLLNDQTPSFELHSPPNGTSASVAGTQEPTSGGDNGKNSGSSSTPVDNKVEGGDADRENVDVSTKIMTRAITEEEVLPE